MSSKLLPGTVFPEVFVTDYKTSARISLLASGRPRLVVFFRGKGCPFCQGAAKHVSDKLAALTAAGIDVVATWADPADVTAPFIADHGVSPDLVFGACLAVEDMRRLGLYVSKPRNYWTQDYDFAEPAYFLLKADNTILYADVGSFPAAACPNIDSLLAVYEWAQRTAAGHSEFASVVWGSA